jgi:hypothetical protein
MSADPDVFRYSLRRVYRTQVRRMLFGVVPFAFVVATGILGLIFDHTASQRHFYRLDLALGAWCLGWLALTVGGLLFMYGASGVYVEGSQVGELVVGHRRPARAGVAHWLRKTVVNPRGFRRSRNLPMLYGIAAHGERVLGVSARFFEPPELERLLARSALRVEGDWSDRMMLTSLRKELPLAAAARLSSRMKLLVAVALMGEVVLIAGTGFMAFRLAQ